MAKKFIEWIEAVSLIILTAACVIGVTKHLDSHKEEPKEDTPIVEELPNEEEPGEETPEILTFTVGSDTYEYVDGMTWADWGNSEYYDSKLSYNPSSHAYTYGGGQLKYNDAFVYENDLIYPVVYLTRYEYGG